MEPKPVGWLFQIQDKVQSSEHGNKHFGPT